MSKVKLSQRIRPNSEAAQWVVDEVILLEQHIEKLEAVEIAHAGAISQLTEENQRLEETISQIWERVRAFNIEGAE